MSYIPSRSQQQAICHKDGPMLVLAGPGSGKTTVIISRTEYLIEKHNISPEQILIITFTKAAAKELYMRLCSKNNPSLARVNVRTFHSFFYQILQHTYGRQLPTIVSSKEQNQILHDLLEQNRIFPLNNLVIKDFLTNISKIKSEIQSEYKTLQPFESSDQVLTRITIQYNQQMAKLHKMDMDDIQQKTYQLLSNNKEICKFWQEQFTYIMIDEYQDISNIQFQCINMLFRKKENIFVVGDDDQSIYGFRGSKPEIMLDFPKQFPNSKQVLLETNYRCSKTIVESALKLIEHNKERFYKEIVPFHAHWTEPVVIKEFKTQQEQLNYIFKVIEENSHLKEKEPCAILYRNNKQIISLVDKFVCHKIPFQAKERLPTIHSHWIVHEVLQTIELAFKESNVQKIRWFKDSRMCEQWKTHVRMIQGLPPFGAVLYIRKAMGFDTYLRKYEQLNGYPHNELAAIIEQFTNSIENMNSWEEYKCYLSFERESLKKSNENQQGVFLTTMHGAKGLEFDEVIIIDANEGTTPYKKAGRIENIEEERRLFYVAMTRAKKKLQILYVKNLQQNLQPSRFIIEAN